MACLVKALLVAAALFSSVQSDGDADASDAIQNLCSYPTSGPSGYFDKESGLTYFWDFCSSTNNESVMPKDCKDVGMCSVSSKVDGDVRKLHSKDFVKSKTINEESSNHYSLSFENDKACDADSKRNYETRFDFFCPMDDELDGTSSSSVTIIKKNDPCKISFYVYKRLPFCPAPGEVSVSGCVVEVPTDDQKLDLTVLKNKTFFNVSSPSAPGKSLHLNLCSGVKGSSQCPDGSAICEVDNSNGKSKVIIGKSWTTTSDFVYGTNVHLVYETMDGKTRAEFTMICPVDNSHTTAIKLLPSSTETSYHFEVQSNRVCMKKSSMSCSAKNPITGATYDLSGLKSSMDDWVAYDDSSKRKYFLSVCKPLSPASLSYSCPGTSGACMKLDKTESVDIGTAISLDAKLEYLTSDRALVMTYPSSQCNDGKTKVYFRCSAIEEGPRFSEKLDGCTYIFDWKTPHACPQGKEVVKTQECTVRENFYGNVFNVTGLHNATADYKVEVGGYDLNVCGTAKCGDDAAVCKNGKVLAKMSTQNLVYKYGQLFLSYDDGPVCDGGKDKKSTSVEITLHCDHKAKIGRPEFVNEDKDTCKHNFVWMTSMACPPFKDVDCTTTDKDGKVYDLSALALPNSNYEVVSDIVGKSTFVLNVCKTLVHTQGSARCPLNAAACLRDDQDQVFTNIGEVTDGPKFNEENQLVLEYPMGGLCKNQNTGETHQSTKIIFKCNMGAYETNPNFVETEGCTHIFYWEHEAACGQVQGGGDHGADDASGRGGDCKVRDELGQMFDLSPLINKTGNIEVTGLGSTYYINICSALHKDDKVKKCGDSSGACKIPLHYPDKAVNLGNFNKAVYLRSADELVLDYAAKDQVQTRIRFKCAPLPSKSDSKLALVADDGVKNVIFDYFTALACKSTVFCEADDLKNGGHYDLTPLMDFQKNAEIIDGQNLFVVSVCKPAVLNSSLPCPHGSAVCYGTKTSNGKFQNVIGYGVAKSLPIVDTNGDLVLKYNSTQTCDKDKKISYSSTIRFKCEPSSFPGAPRLDKEASSKCHKEVVWPTLMACKNATLPIGYNSPTECKIHHPLLMDIVELDNLRSSEDLMVASRTYKTEQYFVQPCGRAHHCNGSICIQNLASDGSILKVASMGSVASSSYDFMLDELRIKYEGGEICEERSGLRYSAEVRYQCDHNADKITKPVLAAKFPCHTIFTWTTRTVCNGYAASSKGSRSKTLHRRSVSSTPVIVFGFVIIGGILLGYVINHKKPHLKELAMESMASAKARLCRRRRQEDQNLLVENNVHIPTFATFGNLNDEEDDELILA